MTARAQPALDGPRIVTTKDILAALRESHQGNSWAYFEELRVAPGYELGDQGRIDAWAIALWPSKNFARTAYEVKADRSDFLSELKKPQKRRRALLYSNLFYFAAPKGLIRPVELPIECGLIEFDWTDRGLCNRTVVQAPWRDTVPPSWRFFAAVARRVCQAERTGSTEL